MVALPNSESRWLLAIVHVELTLSSWGVPSHLARHWLQQAQPTLDSALSVSLTLDVDHADDLLTIELLDDEGARVFGIDAYLGAPELVSP